jgi:hypothetical protein
MYNQIKSLFKTINAKLAIAALALAANYASAQAATSVVVMFSKFEYVYDYATADTVEEAKTMASLNLLLRGYTIRTGYYPLGAINYPQHGYTAVAGEYNSLNRLVYLGVGFNESSLAAAQQEALKSAIASKAKAPKVITSIVDVTIPTPSQMSPAANQTGVHRPTTFIWAQGNGVGLYEIQVDFVPDQGTPYLIDSSKTKTTSYTSLKLGPGRTYRWRVRAWSQDNLVASRWSSYRQFSTRVTQ